MESKRSINVRYFNRPVKVAFIVPFVESKITHWILDGIFYEAYSRWGGAKSLIIPFEKDRFIFAQYLDWLEMYDADIVYSYVDLTPEQIYTINKKTLPIEMRLHEVYQSAERWQQFIPRWPHYFSPIRAISAINSPYAKYQDWSNAIQPNLYITQHYENDEHRFLPDNFGVSQGGSGSNLGRQNIFGTICYCAQDLPAYHYVGDERCHSLSDFMNNLAEKQVKTFSKLSSIHAATISHPNEYEWANSFNLFVGHSLGDRLNFWNSRLLSENSDQHNFCALCISEEHFDDEGFLTSLGKFINAHNYKGVNNGPRSLRLRSLSIAKEKCEQIAQKLDKLTHSHVKVCGNFNSPALPSEKTLKGYYRGGVGIVRSLKVYDRELRFVVDEVDHLKYLTPEIQDFKSGQCITDVHIENPKKNYSVAGGFNDWKLPRRLEATVAFTNNKAKISRSGSISTIPSAPQQPLDRVGQYELTISLVIPDEQDVLRCLVLDHFHRLRFDRDLRFQPGISRYYDLELSDKGKKHRGVISLFDGDVSQAGILANSYWRRIVRSSIESDKVSFSLGKLISMINMYTPDSLAHIMNQMNLADDRETRSYLISNLKDTIEYLVHQGVLIQEYRWRCSYCGNENGLTLDTIKLDNHCTICGNLHKTPIDMNWNYKVAPFITSALIEQNGLTVLWAVDHLINTFNRFQAFYLPEIMLFKSPGGSDNNEIDFIAVIDGKFVVAEVKLSAASFTDNPNEVATFIDEIQRLSPDTAFLIFEQYCQNHEEIEGYKNKLNIVLASIREIVSYVEVKAIVASEVEDFYAVPVEIGPWGERTYAFFDRLDRRGPQ